MESLEWSSSAVEPTKAGKTLAEPKPGKKLHSLLLLKSLKTRAGGEDIPESRTGTSHLWGVGVVKPAQAEKSSKKV